jgi:hypothetical protein
LQEFFVCSQSDNHPKVDLAKSGYKPGYIFSYMHTEKTMYRKLIISTIFHHFWQLKTSKITSFSDFFLFSVWILLVGEISPMKRKADQHWSKVQISKKLLK